MEKVYILQTHTGTVISNIIRKVLNTPYSHVSISMDELLTEVYSFGRINANNPLIAGFINEYINSGLYKKKKNTICRVSCVEIDNNQYKDMKKILYQFKKEPRKYKYDFKALILLMFNVPRENETKYVCSQFVAYIFEKSGKKLFNKPSKLITPLDFYNLKEGSIIYEGYLRDYKDALRVNENKKVKTNLFK